MITRCEAEGALENEAAVKLKQEKRWKMCLYGEGRVNKATAAGRYSPQKEAGLGNG